jgi:hypothetical protein
MVPTASTKSCREGDETDDAVLERVMWCSAVMVEDSGCVKLSTEETVGSALDGEERELLKVGGTGALLSTSVPIDK